MGLRSVVASVATGVLVVGVVAAVAPAAARAQPVTPAAPSDPWVSAPAPGIDGPPDGRLDAVSCTSATSCLAVGSRGNSAAPRAVSEVWNGVAWRLVPVAGITETVSALSAVSCATPTACMAVGYVNATGDPSTVDRTLAVFWNGTTWSRKTTVDGPRTTGMHLSAVSCSTATSCTAVGSATTTPPVAQIWDGTTWRLLAAPAVGGVTPAFTGLSCYATNKCVAVGSVPVAGSVARQPVAEIRSGSAWSVMTLPGLPDGYQSGELEAVACQSAGHCIAVGWMRVLPTSPVLPLSMKLTGSTWTLQEPPAGTTGYAALTAVACPSLTNCVAVGYRYQVGSNASTPLAELWNGSAWTVSNGADPHVGLATTNGVSCPAVNVCTTVVSAPLGTLAQTYDGADWAVRHMPQAASTIALADVVDLSCSSATWCMTVGSWVDSSGRSQPYTAVWDGGGWTQVPVPVPTGLYTSAVTAVSCSSPTQCVAAGRYEGTSTSGPTIYSLFWDGSAWRRVNFAGHSPAAIPPTGVSCVSATFCVAVSTQAETTTRPTPLVQVWNGSAWSVTPTPTTRGYGYVMSSVSCASAAECVAVGLDRGSQFSTAWDGTSWTQTTPPQVSIRSGLQQVSCVLATTFCLAFSDVRPYGGWSQVWDGTAWTNVVDHDIPTPSPGGGTVVRMSCASTTVCTEVEYGPRSYDYNGAHWTAATSLAALPREPLALSCSTDLFCMTAGTATDGTPTVAIRGSGSAAPARG